MARTDCLASMYHVPVEGAPSSHVAKPPYASPEVLRSGTVDTRSDLYSFAAVVYEMATGRPPYGDKHSIHDVLTRLARWHPPSMHDLAPQLRALIGDMFHDSPDERVPNSAQGARAVLPALHTMQTARTQLAAMVEPLFQRAFRDSKHQHVPQLCFDVPFIVQESAAEPANDWSGDTEVDTVVPEVDLSIDSVDRGEECRDNSVARSLQLAGLEWTQEGDSGANSEAETAPIAVPDVAFTVTDRPVPTLAGHRSLTSTVGPTLAPNSGSLRTMDPVTFFLDTLHAWFQASKSATDEDGAATPLDLAGVHAAYAQLDEPVKAQTSLEWSHFLQACKISPPHYQWIWLAMEDLAAALGYDGSYFDPDLAHREPEPDEPKVDLTLTDREVEWARHIFFSMFEQVHGHRPDGTAAITDDMDETQRFLAQLSALVIYFPVLSNKGVVSLRNESLDGESLFVAEQDVTLLFNCYEALPEALREAIEPEWVELGSAIYDANAFRFRFRSLYERMAAKLEPVDMEALEDAPTAPLHRVNGRTRLAVVRPDSDSGQTTVSNPVLTPTVRQASDDRGHLKLAPLTSLPSTNAAPVFVGPVSVPQDLSGSPQKQRSAKQLALAGASIAAVAAIALALLVPKTGPQNPPIAPSERATAIQSLPITEQAYPTCAASPERDTTQQPATARPAAPLPTPTQRKASKLQFVKDTDSVVIQRENKPNLMLTVTEVSDEGLPIKKAKKSKRVHTIEAREFTGFGLSVGMSDDYQLAVEPAR